MTRYGDLAWEAVVDEVLEETWKFSPISATFAGIHQYDGQLDHVDEISQNNYLKKEKSWLSILGGFEQANELSAECRLDLEMLAANIRKDIASDRMFNRLRNDPSFYPNNAIFACLIFLIRDFLSKEERFSFLISRLKEIPRYLSEGKSNLRMSESIPPLWLGMAVEMTQSGQRFFTQLITRTAMEIQPLRNDILAAATLASKAFDDYLKFLNEELSRKAPGNFACGEEYFDFLLKEYHLLPYSPEELEAIGIEYIGLTLKQMKSIASEIAPGRDLFELLEEIKSDTPAASKLLEAYRLEMNRTREFVLEKDLVDLPVNEMLEIMETPGSERATLPYAAYMAPAPFEEPQHGFFWVTPIDGDASPERAKEQLLGHSRAAIEVRTLHEGYPGHHLQLCLANRNKSKIRRIYGTPVFVEGWALYCEDLMKQKGYYSDRRTELIQLKDQLWRACRVVIDVRLHSGRFSFDEAVAMLIEIAHLERPNAEAEVRRYSQTPTQPMSYLIGKIEIEKLAADFRRRYPQISLKEFHNRLLSFGSIPVSLVRRGIMGTI
jgi:uncharacterized protein (DUF885 family)